MTALNQITSSVSLNRHKKHYCFHELQLSALNIKMSHVWQWGQVWHYWWPDKKENTADWMFVLFLSDYSVTFHLSGWAPGVYASPRHLIGQLSLLCGGLQTYTHPLTHTQTYKYKPLHYSFCCGGRPCTFLATVHLRELLEVWGIRKSFSCSICVSPPASMSLTHTYTVY